MDFHLASKRSPVQFQLESQIPLGLGQERHRLCQIKNVTREQHKHILYPIMIYHYHNITEMENILLCLINSQGPKKMIQSK